LQEVYSSYLINAMPKPKGHKPGCKCPFCSNIRKGGKVAKAKKVKKVGGGVTHKSYSYTNKNGKTVHVEAHVEHPHRRK